MQLIKGRFSFRIKKKFGYLGEVWQGGFSEVRVDDPMSLARHKDYITQNPVKAALVDLAEDYPYCFASLAKRKQQGLNRLRKNSVGASLLKGHGFIRADKSNKFAVALAAEGCLSNT